MHYLLNQLTEKPLIGMTATSGGLAVTFIDAVTPICQLIAVLVGIAVGILTIVLTLKKIRNENKNR